MLIDRRATVLLVLGDQPFVSPGKDIISEFARVGPPGIAVIAEAEKPPLLEPAQAQVLLGYVLFIESRKALSGKGTHLTPIGLSSLIGSFTYSSVVSEHPRLLCQTLITYWMYSM